MTTCDTSIGHDAYWFYCMAHEHPVQGRDLTDDCTAVGPFGDGTEAEGWRA